jgi:hypothetical protein
VPLLMRRARACGLCCTDLQKNRKGPQDTGQNAMEWDTDISLTCTSDAPRNRALTRNRDGFPTKPSRRFRWDVPRGPTQAGHWGPGAESEDLRRRSQGDQGSACVPKRRGDRREALNVEGSPGGAGIHQAINRSLKLRGIAQRLTGWKREASRGKPLRMQFVDLKGRGISLSYPNLYPGVTGPHRGPSGSPRFRWVPAVIERPLGTGHEVPIGTPLVCRDDGETASLETHG